MGDHDISTSDLECSQAPDISLPSPQELVRLQQHLIALRNEPQPLKWRRRFKKGAHDLEEALAACKAATDERRSLRQRIKRHTLQLQLLDLEQQWHNQCTVWPLQAPSVAWAVPPAAAVPPATPSPVPPCLFVPAVQQQPIPLEPATATPDGLSASPSTAPFQPSDASRPIHFDDLPPAECWSEAWRQRVCTLTPQDLAHLHHDWLQHSALLLLKAKLCGRDSPEHQQLTEYAERYTAFNQHLMRLIPVAWRRRSLYDLHTLTLSSQRPDAAWLDQFLTRWCKSKPHLLQAFKEYRDKVGALRERCAALSRQYTHLASMQVSGQGQSAPAVVVPNGAAALSIGLVADGMQIGLSDGDGLDGLEVGTADETPAAVKTPVQKTAVATAFAAPDPQTAAGISTVTDAGDSGDIGSMGYACTAFPGLEASNCTPHGAAGPATASEPDVAAAGGCHSVKSSQRPRGSKRSSPRRTQKGKGESGRPGASQSTQSPGADDRRAEQPPPLVARRSLVSGGQPPLLCAFTAGFGVADGLGKGVGDASDATGGEDGPTDLMCRVDALLCCIEANLAQQQLVLRQCLFSVRFSEDVIDQTRLYLLLYPHALDMVDFLEAAVGFEPLAPEAGDLKEAEAASGSETLRSEEEAGFGQGWGDAAALADRLAAFEDSGKEVRDECAHGTAGAMPGLGLAQGLTRHGSQATAATILPVYGFGLDSAWG